MGVIEQIEGLGLTKTQLNHCYHILYLIGVNPSRDRQLFTDYQPLAKVYLQQVLGDKHYRYINILGDAGIIDCDNIYHTGKALCYRFNKGINFNDEYKTVTFSYKSKVTLSDYTSNRQHRQHFIKLVQNLNIPFDKLYAKKDEILKNLSIDDYSLDYDIIWDEPRLVTIIDENGEFEVKRFNKDAGIDYATQLGLSVIEDKTKLRIMDTDTFIENKKHFVNSFYTNCIESLKDESSLYAKRNRTNNRLDTNFTQLATSLLDIIYEENGIVEVDAMNSQPALLAHKLDLELLKGEDVEQFKTIAYNGSFYEFIAEQIGVDRKRAKIMMFEVLFSGSRCNSKNKKMFRELFPTVWEYISDFKNLYGKEQFAIMLQKVESSIFITTIYTQLTASHIDSIQ